MTDAPDAEDQSEPPRANRERFKNFVVIGSSAGGVDALLSLVFTLPGRFPAPIVVAQHLDPRRPSHLARKLEVGLSCRASPTAKRPASIAPRLCCVSFKQQTT